MVRLVTFDVYMVLVDIKGSLVPKVTEILGLNKLKADKLSICGEQNRWNARRLVIHWVAVEHNSPLHRISTQLHSLAF